MEQIPQEKIIVEFELAQDVEDDLYKNLTPLIL